MALYATDGATSSSTQGRSGRGVTAVLGPTNTGKTHLAIDRLIAHKSGMIGLPLRLLAREVYGRVVERVGAEAVALITGEEKIKPEGARYFVCTVEAMPTDVEVDFLAVDEVQLAADLERGHVFTDRMLNHRGQGQTMLLGAQTMQPLIEKLLPSAHIVTRPRLSTLTFAGDRKITRLPRRSAIVAFSADEVYAIAELIRRQRGGAAVVMGALSPRTRNAQVALYQNGDVDFLIATDAIGMGLNLDVDHVAFAAERKFDGFQHRRLNPGEFGQIAGRAGRYTKDGTFGTTGRAEPFEPELVQRLESHAFEPVKVLQWRNTALDFSSIDALRDSLDQVPDREGLTRAPLGDDRQALDIALRDRDIADAAQGRARVELLWNVCAVPDYRRIAPAQHAELVATLYRALVDEGAIPEDWFAQQVGYADRVDGDIDTLSNRIAHIRTWTYVANRPDWLRDAEHWRATTRAVEDRLSDALHEALTQRFVDRRTSVLMRRLQESEDLEAHVEPDGRVEVESHFVGRLTGLSFEPDVTTEATHGRAIRVAAQRVLADELKRRADSLSGAKDDAFTLETDGRLLWRGATVAQLERGDDVLKPKLRFIADEALSGPARERAEARLNAWLEARIKTLVQPLFALREAQGVEGLARGVAYRIAEGLGIVSRRDIADEVQSLDQATRSRLRTLGVRFGAYNIFVPTLLKPAPRRLLAQLHALATGEDMGRLEGVLALASSGRTSVPVSPDMPESLYRAAGYRVAGRMAVRVDILERLADIIRPLIAWKPPAEDDAPAARPEGAEEGNAFRVTVPMTSLVGCAGEDFASVLQALDYRRERRPAAPDEMRGAAPAREVAATSADEGSAMQADVSASDPSPAMSEPAAPEPATPEAAAAPEQIEGPETAAADVAASPGGQDAEGAEASEPQMIDIWRPRPPRRRQPQRARQQRGAPRTDAQAAPATPEEERQRPRNGKPRRFKGKREERRDAAPPPRPAARQPERRRADPDSPFAALAALKERLESDRGRP
jgi:ATP-dependent RNA helicase SUPV3L1/SUV3